MILNLSLEKLLKINTMIIINIILPLLTIAILIYIVINLLRKVEALEDDVDDETSFVFTEIQTALDKLNNEINPNGEEKKEEK